MKEIDEDTNNGKIHHTHGLEELILLKCLYLTKAVCRFTAIPIKLPMAFFTGLEQRILKLVWKHEDPKYPQQSLQRRGITCHIP